MPTIITLDLDDLLDKIQDASSNAPSMLEQASALGFAIPTSASKYIGMAGIGAQMLKKFMPKGGKTGLEAQGMPDTGPLGRGRMTYLRNKHKYSDADVVQSINRIMEPSNGLPGTNGLETTINFTMSIMFPGAENAKSDQQVRAAVDQILDKDGLSQGVCDKFGDLINYCLTTIEVKK